MKQDLHIDWETDYQEKNRFIAYVASLCMETACQVDTVPQQYEEVYELTFIDPEKIDFLIFSQGEAIATHIVDKYIGSFWELGKYPTVPLSDESNNVEIVIDPEEDEFDLSLLGEEEREFFENFVGAFDPGPNFTEDDLKIDDIP